MAAQDGGRPNQTVNSPFFLVPLLLGIGMIFATAVWMGARREAAALYGIIRSIEAPFVNKLAPHAKYFSIESLKEVVPSFSMIYENSLMYGLFFTALIFLLMTTALLRLEKFSILKWVSIKSDKGRTYTEVMERIADTEPSVRFFLDYNVMDLPTTEGSARQPMRAIELLLFTNSIQYVKVDKAHTTPPDLELDTTKLRAWMCDRFGPKNPFIDITKRRLLDVREVHRAVDDMSWYAVLLLYPALYRVYAFYVLDSQEGYKTAQAEIDDFINGIWTELNGFKSEFRDGIQLGFANSEDRAERDAFYRASKKKGSSEDDKPDNFTASNVLDNLTDLTRVFRNGRISRGEIESPAEVFVSKAGAERPAKPKAPEHLLFFGEVLSERGPNLDCVKAARDGLKDILTRHLGDQRGEYPVSNDPDTGLVVYDRKIATQEQKAFNIRAQERLARAEQAIEKVLFSHQYEFSVVGGALEQARRFGIMPPNLFRWLRFCEETTPFWWFVQNLGMPAAYPENAGHFEHYQAEKAMGVAVEQPHIHSALEGIRREACRYLVPETIDELTTILGKDALVSEVVNADVIGDIIPKFEDELQKQVNDIESNVRKPRREEDSPENSGQKHLERLDRSEARRSASGSEVSTQDSILDQFDLDE